MNTLSPTLTPVTTPATGTYVSSAVAPSGNYYDVLFSFTTPAKRHLSVNGILYAESLPAIGYSLSSISNNGYTYYYPLGATSVGTTTIYECANSHCLLITSTNSVRGVGDTINH